MTDKALLQVLLLLAALLPVDGLFAQRVLLLERANQSRSDRRYEQQSITFRMRGDKFYQSGRIDELRPDIQAMVINDRFIVLDEIESLRMPGSGLLNYTGLSLMVFGGSWSVFALAGYTLDGNPETNYGTLDLTVTITGLTTGFLLRKLFGRRKFTLGKRKRLRVVDLSF